MLFPSLISYNFNNYEQKCSHCCYFMQVLGFGIHHVILMVFNIVFDNHPKDIHNPAFLFPIQKHLQYINVIYVVLQNINLRAYNTTFLYCKYFCIRNYIPSISVQGWPIMVPYYWNSFGFPFTEALGLGFCM